MKIKKIKDWKSKRDEAVQFQIISRNEKGEIDAIRRIIDGEFFDKDRKYPGLRYNYIKFDYFYENLIGVEFTTFSTTGERSGLGLLPINSIIIIDKQYTDTITERTCNELEKQGLKIFY